jgi:asparagine synthase (glutamine-hydrolysing)
MCGIAGIWSANTTGNQNIDPQKTTNAMVDTLVHRGPDDHGVWIDGQVGFGHRRLKVIDLEGGSQPMSDPHNRLWLVFNGEIYNFQQLRDQLTLRGHTFRTQSDTEALLYSYIEWGLDALNHLEGMFAFAIWDRTTNTLHLARDRLGIKPLFWAQCDNRVVFASEIKAILTTPGFPRRLNPKTLAYYLRHDQSVMGDQTLFQDIQTVEPGTVVSFCPNPDSQRHHIQTHRYWTFPIVPHDNKQDRGQGYYMAKVRDLLTRAVERQIISDVPLGAYLSGGLDSTILVGLMRQLGVKPLKTYSIGFDGSELNEFPYSRLASTALDTDHTEITISADQYFATLEELIQFKDTPLTVPNEVPLFLMSKILKNDITVVLSGEGADELFGGYATILRTPMDLRNLNALSGQKREDYLAKLSSFYGTLNFHDELSHFQATYCWMTPEELQKLLQPSYLCSSDNDPVTNYWEQKFQPLRQLLPEDRILNILETIHLGGLLARLDTTTMAASVEGRVPFTDTDLLEFAATMPLEYKLHWRSPEHHVRAQHMSCVDIAENLDIPKYILKQSFQDIVPQPIIARRKAAFPVPIDSWLHGNYREHARDIITRGTVMPDVFNMSEIHQWLQHPHTANHGLKLWMLMNISLWLDAYFT